MNKFFKGLAVGAFALALTAFGPVGGGGSGGGGGGLFPTLINVPSKASAGFGSGTWLNQGSATETDVATGMSFSVPQNGNEFSGIIKAAPATPYHVVFLLIPQIFGTSTTDVTNENGITVGWYDGTNKLDTFLLYGRGSGNFNASHYTFSNPTTLAANTAVSAQMYGGGALALWYRLGNDGTNITFDVSSDGVTWANEYSVAVGSGYLSSYADIAIGMTNFAGPWSFTVASYTD